MRFEGDFESAICREHVRVAYLDALQDDLSHENAFREAFEQAVLSLTNSHVAGLRGVKEESLRDAAWLKLSPRIEKFAEIESQVVDLIVRVVVDEALRLKNSRPESDRCVALPVETTPIAAAVSA